MCRKILNFPIQFLTVTRHHGNQTADPFDRNDLLNDVDDLASALSTLDNVASSGKPEQTVASQGDEAKQLVEQILVGRVCLILI